MNLKDLADGLGLNSTTQGALLVLNLVLVFLWWITSSAQSQVRRELDILRNARAKLYSPAIGLLKCRQSGLVSHEEFKQRFVDLVISERSRVSLDFPELRHALDRWLEGQDNEESLEVYFEHASAEVNERLQNGQALKFWVVHHWLSTTFFNVLTSLSVVLLTVALGVVLKLSADRSFWWPLGISLGIAILGSLIRQSAAKRRKSDLDERMAHRFTRL